MGASYGHLTGTDVELFCFCMKINVVLYVFLVSISFLICIDISYYYFLSVLHLTRGHKGPWVAHLRKRSQRTTNAVQQ